ncbi:VOC family protein [Jeotgalibacillus sp. ET6]|uniref:VOC family protein n=1 Tax=Jeotgalibacillus sp. ET6 TaxID=3037260 RepID=UPI002418AD29|nr:VOC family protein [Jeotgalibacillus sp. ET6]MDG5472267.1 VOC family protein [Jeotgalibacillus sp. ET6]
MNQQLIRVGTTYLPVKDVQGSANWYVKKLGAELSYQDEEKAILNIADQSFFLVKSKPGQSANFIDHSGRERFSITFEVDGVDALKQLHADFQDRHIPVGEIEERGHTGQNFTFRDPCGNKFDVWSELSIAYKENQKMSS